MQVMDVNIKDKLRLVQTGAIGSACTPSPTYSHDHHHHGDKRGAS